jgi:hypothetical protein
VVQVKPFRNVICPQDEEEARLLQQLREARKRMRKHIKLQVGLAKGPSACVWTKSTQPFDV